MKGMASSRQHEEHDKKENAMGVERSEGHGHCVCVRERMSDQRTAFLYDNNIIGISHQNGYD